MSIIEATSRRCTTMADGTLRLTVDIDPRKSQDAFKLFGAPDTPMALAALTQEASSESARKEMIKDAEPKGGPLAKLAANWCKMPEFWEWASKHNITSEQEAAAWLRDVCGIESRAELDCNELAARYFHEYIREPFSKVLRNASA